MSLINDALKKAQKQRTGEAPSLPSMPSVGGESAASISRRAKSGGPGGMLIGAGAAVAVLLLVGGWFAFRSSSDTSRADAKPAAVAPAATLAKADSPPANEKPAPISFVLPVAQTPKGETAVPVSAPSSQFPAPSVAKPSPPAAKPQDEPRRSSPSATGPAVETAAATLKLDPRAIQYIDNIKVAGIRASATDAKVLMNDRVYRIGSQVDAELGLKLAGITANSLTFEDERGARYTRTF